MRVIAGQHMQAIRRAGAFLDGAEIRGTTKSVQRILIHIDAHPAGIIVKHGTGRFAARSMASGMEGDLAARRVGIRRGGN